MLDQLPQTWVGPEEVLPQVFAVCNDEPLRLAVGGLVHAIHEDAVDVAREQLVPLATPDDLDDLPTRTTEDRLELLDDLAVAAARAVQGLQVAVHDEGEIVEAFARRERQRAE